MTRFILVVLMLTPHAALLSQNPQPPARHPAFEIDFANVKWTKFPGVETPVRISILYVDSISGATQMLFRIPANATAPCHWHTATESNMVVQGSVVMRHAGATAASTLGVGGFSFVPKRMPHQLTTGPTLTIIFSALDGRFDFHAVSDAQCRASGEVHPTQ